MSDVFIIKCVVCKTKFDQKNSNVRLCLDCKKIAKQESINKHKRLRLENKINEYAINCKFCKQNFLAYSKQRKYCSHTCRTKYHNIPDNIISTEIMIDKLVLKLEILKSYMDQ